MKFIVFTEKDAVKVNIIDTQHQEIIEIINKLYDYYLNNNKDRILTNLDKLKNLLKEHFETEELLMKGNNFPGYISHKLEHDRYIAQINKITDKYKDGERILDLEQFDSFKKWFFNHLDFNDKKCGEYLNSVGIS